MAFTCYLAPGPDDETLACSTRAMRCSGAVLTGAALPDSGQVSTPPTQDGVHTSSPAILGVLNFVPDPSAEYPERPDIPEWPFGPVNPASNATPAASGTVPTMSTRHWAG